MTDQLKTSWLEHTIGYIVSLPISRVGLGAPKMILIRTDSTFWMAAVASAPSIKLIYTSMAASAPISAKSSLSICSCNLSVSTKNGF